MGEACHAWSSLLPCSLFFLQGEIWIIHTLNSKYPPITEGAPNKKQVDYSGDVCEVKEDVVIWLFWFETIGILCVNN